MAASSPTLAGFLDFVRSIMQVNTTVLPDSAPIIEQAYDLAIAITNQALANAPGPVYQLAVYNLGGDYIINWAPDQSGQTYFRDLRESWKLSNFVAGTVQATNDESTGTSLTAPKFTEGLTLSDLQNLKTPYGRQYLALAQRYGTLWGMS